MSLVLQITSGSRTGERAEFTKAVVLVGRHPDCDLRFDVHKDLDVSTRHAELRGGASGWSVFDLGSTNGTFVNGQKASGVHALRPGDVIMFGSSGPRVEVVATGGKVDDAVAPRTEMRPSAGSNRPKTEERIAIAVAKETGSLKKFVIGLGIVVLLGVGGLVWMNQRSTAQSNAVIQKLMARSDSLANELQRAVTDAGSRATGFDSVVRVLREQRDQLSKSLKAGGNVQQISTQLDALQRQGNQAVMLTSRQNSDANGKAVGYVVVEDQAKKSFSGTAFCVTPSGLMVTNSHVLLDDQGRPPNRIGVYFTDTDRLLLAHFVSVSKEADVGFFQIDEPGKYPTVLGIASSPSLGVGDPVMVIGFPLGTDLKQQGATKKSTLTVGVVSKIISDEITLNAFSAQGSSGSPVFDAHGNVIGVLNAGIGGTTSSLSLVVPSKMLIAALPADARAIVR